MVLVQCGGTQGLPATSSCSLLQRNASAQQTTAEGLLASKKLNFIQFSFQIADAMEYLVSESFISVLLSPLKYCSIYLTVPLTAGKE